MWFWKLYWKYTILVIYCSNFNRQSNRKIVHNNKTHPCFIWTKTSRFHEEIKYKNKAVFGIVIFASILGQGLTGTKLAAWQGWWSTRKCSERLIIGICRKSQKTSIASKNQSKKIFFQILKGLDLQKRILQCGGGGNLQSYAKPNM